MIIIIILTLVIPLLTSMSICLQLFVEMILSVVSRLDLNVSCIENSQVIMILKIDI